VKSLTFLQDLDDKRLDFLGDNRPAKRYLYFRFIITYLYAKRNGNTSFPSKVESRSSFFASPGPYLRRSTLISLGRNISGVELPRSIFDDTTFENDEVVDSETVGAMLSAQLRNATIQSEKERQREEKAIDEDLEIDEDTSDDENNDE
jgi:hypothetical protein